MDTSQIIENQVNALLSNNEIYSTYRTRWNEMYQAYIGGEDYTLAGHLHKFQLESQAEYSRRLQQTPLENHCKSCLAVYNSFLFKSEPYRDLGALENNPITELFLKDADQDGQSLNEMMRDVSTWSSVFGHVWLLLTKPNLGLRTQAEELSAGVRPYLNMLTPLAVTDWNFTRDQIGKYNLDYFKYIEDFNGDIQVIKEWTKEVIKTTTVNTKERTILNMVEEENQLGMIPAVCAYNQRSDVRGIGVSDLQDIALQQKHIYNLTSEAVQAIQLGTHPSVVATPNTQMGQGPGSIIQMEEGLDPGLKPYTLEFSSAPIESIYKSINHAIDAIDKMANTGAVRATESKTTMSGVAMEVEMSLLNARLAQKGSSLQLAEEQIWNLFAGYLGTQFNGEITYPNSFNIRDKDREIQQLKIAKETASDPKILQYIDGEIAEWLEIEDYEGMDDTFEIHQMRGPNGDVVTVTSQAQHEQLVNQGYGEA
jgi:hypothetical protein